jgi:uncharacterized protein YggU (UPF0235/DUF167 family)
MTYVRVQVNPSAKKESLIQTDEKTYSISVKEPAKQNLANMRVRELLARHLGVPTAKVRMVSGHRSPRKIFDIDS